MLRLHKHLLCFHDLNFFRTYLGGQHRLVLFSLQDLKEMFHIHGHESSGRNIGARIHSDLGIGSSQHSAVVDSSGPIWKNNRRVFLNHLRVFGRQKQLNLVLDEAKQLTDYLETCPKNYEPSELLQAAVGNVIAALIFGSRFDYFEPEAHKVFDAIVDFNTKLDLLPSFVFYFLKYVPLSKKVTARIRACSTARQFIRNKVNDRIRSGIQDPAETLIDAYAAELGKAGWKSDIDNLVAVIIELFFAGTETTSTTLCWVLACLASHPEIQDRIVEEIQTVAGDAELTIQHLRDLQYTNAVQNEVQRFGCIATNTIPHRMIDTVQMESGNTVQKGEVVSGALYTIMRDPAHFKYPEEFNPGNFLDETGTQLQTIEAFVPYGVGPRVCLGQVLADLEVKVFMIEIVRKFKVTSSDHIDIHTRVQKITSAPLEYKYNFELR